MPWIRQEDVNVSDVMKIMSINPGAMEAVGNLNRAITFGASALRIFAPGNRSYRDNSSSMCRSMESM